MLMRANTQRRWSGFLPLVLAGAALGWCASPAPAELVLQTVYTSAAGRYNTWFSALTQTPDGSFYGTTPAYDGSSPYGTVFRMTRAGALTTRQIFLGVNGLDPEGGLLLASDGGLYGTTMGGGAYSLGTIYRITASGLFQTVAAFNGTNGASPMFTLIQARDGFLYGVTLHSGTNNTGAAMVFRASTAGVVTTLTNLPAYTMPSDGLVEGPDGWLYGTTTAFSFSGGPIGSIYKVSTNGTFRTLASFYDGPVPLLWGSGDRPIGGLTAGTDGFLYGTIGHSLVPMATSNGSVFRMTTNGVKTTLCSFSGTNGSNPLTRLLLAKDGAFYGMTAQGGPSGDGTIFRVTTNGLLTTLAGGFGFYSANSSIPPLMQADDGNLYGTGIVPTSGSYLSVIWRLVPPPNIAGQTLSNGRLTLTWTSFTNGGYQVACKGAINETNWTALGSTITATGGEAAFSYFPGSTAQRFYRVTLLP